MRIAIDCHSLEYDRGGAGSTYILNLLKYFDDVASSRFAGSGETRNEAELFLYFKKKVPNDPELQATRYKRQVTSPISSNALFVHWFLPRALHRDKIDVLFAPYYVAPYFWSEPLAVTIHDLSFEVYPETLDWADQFLLRNVAKRAAHAARIVIAPSQFAKEEMLHRWRISKEKIHVIPLGVDERFHRVENDLRLSNVREKYGLYGKMVLFVGTMFERRHVGELIFAFEKLARDDRDLRLLLVGRDPEGTVRKAHLANQRLGRRAVTHVDNVRPNELVYLYNLADLFVWLSDYEGFGLPPLEAMACATPVVASKAGSLPEVLGDAALYVENSSDIEEITLRMKNVLKDNALRTDLIQKGLSRSLNFSWRKTASQTLNVLTSIR